MRRVKHYLHINAQSIPSYRYHHIIITELDPNKGATTIDSGCTFVLHWLTKFSVLHIFKSLVQILIIDS